MPLNEIDEKQAVRNAVKAYLASDHPDQLEDFEMAFEGMYTMLSDPDETSGDSAEPPQDGPAIDAGQIVDAGIIAAALWTAKAIFRPIVRHVAKQVVLPSLQETMIGVGKRIGRGSMGEKVGRLLEREIRDHLDLPSDG